MSDTQSLQQVRSLVETEIPVEIQTEINKIVEFAKTNMKEIVADELTKMYLCGYEDFFLVLVQLREDYQTLVDFSYRFTQISLKFNTWLASQGIVERYEGPPTNLEKYSPPTIQWAKEP